MREGWATVRFGDLYLVPSKNGLMAPKRVRGEGIPLVNMREIFAFDRIGGQEMELAPLPISNPEAWLLMEGDLLFARQSLIVEGAGKCSLVLADPRKRTFESHIIRVRVNPEKADSRFYFYLFRSRIGRELMASIVEQVAAAGIRASDLARLEVPCPSVQEQRRIADVLTAFDDLIDSNYAISRRAESLAVTLAYSSPDRMPLTNLALVANVRQFRPDGPVEYFSIPAFDEGQLPARINGELIMSGKLLLAEPTVLVSRLNPQTPRVWMAYPGDVPAAASTEFVPLVGAGSVAVEEVWATCAGDEFAAQMMARVTGTTGSHQRVDKAAIPRLLVADVRKLDGRKRTTIISLVREANASLVSASEAAHVRDELLPLLLSGQVRVEEMAA